MRFKFTPGFRPFSLLFFCVVNLCGSFPLHAATNTETPHTVYEFAPDSISGKPFPLSQYKGKVLLIVNTASKCGFTPQYHDLESLYNDYKSRGFEVLAFPSNDFAEQEPGSNSDIKKFCTLNYGVTFPIFSRAPVSGGSAQPLFKYLTTGGQNAIQGEIAWNFEKFLVGRDGTIKARFGSYVNPESHRIKDVIEKLLDEKE